MAVKRGFGAARAYTEDQLGGPCDETESNPTVQLTAGVILQGNPDRVGLVFINLGANDVYIALNSAVSATNGIKVGASGGSATLNVRDDFTLVSRTWYGIASGGTSAIYILEEIRDQYTQPSEGA